MSKKIGEISQKVRNINKRRIWLREDSTRHAKGQRDSND
jgi:hypothetical protein